MPTRSLVWILAILAILLVALPLVAMLGMMSGMMGMGGNMVGAGALGLIWVLLTAAVVIALVVVLVRGRKPSISRVVMLGAALVVVSALVLLAAPAGYRLGILPLRVALQTFLTWGAYGALGAAGLALAGLVMTLRRPRQARGGTVLAALTLLVAVVLIGIPGRFRLGEPKPPIHDITTDTQDPPQFVAVLPLRANAPNSTVYGGEQIASQQHEAYPDLETAMLDVPPDQAFDRALGAVRDMDWEVVAADASAGRIEATDTTFWFGFTDDVVVRVRPAGRGSRVDVRSLSRIGVGDAGTNAKRVRAFLRALRVE